MPRVLDETTVDPVEQQIDEQMSAADMAEAAAQFAPTPADQIGDLSDGGVVNGATLYPMVGGKKQSRGRASARRAWTWDGRESLLPLAWNPAGTRNDGARAFLTKRRCMCCGDQGGSFREARCKRCIDSLCPQCNQSTQPEKIIPVFYLNQDDVPYPAHLYGDVNCFLTTCQRQGARGFKLDQDMRMHARTRHRMEYQAYLEGLGGPNAEIADLRRLVMQLQANQQQQIMVEPEIEEQLAEAVAGAPVKGSQEARDRMAKARAGKANKQDNQD